MSTREPGFPSVNLQNIPIPLTPEQREESRRIRDALFGQFKAPRSDLAEIEARIREAFMPPGTFLGLLLSEGGVCVRSCCGTAAGEVELASLREERDAWQQAYYAVRALQEAQAKTPAETVAERTYNGSAAGEGMADHFVTFAGTGRTSASAPNEANTPKIMKCPACSGGVYNACDGTDCRCSCHEDRS